MLRPVRVLRGLCPGLPLALVLLAGSAALLPLARSTAGEQPAETPVTGWRGDGSGSFPVTRPPLHWSTEEGVAWSTPMPAQSNAMPLVVGERVITCADPHSLICVDRSTGKILWTLTGSDEDAAGPEAWPEIAKELEQARPLQQEESQLERQLRKTRNHLRELAESGRKTVEGKNREELQQLVSRIEQRMAEITARLEQLPLAQKHRTLPTHTRKNGYTTATPVSDGQHVWAVFGNAVVMCCTLEGERVWIRKMDDRPNAMFGHSASPLLAGDRLIIAIEDTVALNPLTGSELWRTRFGQSWGTAALHTVSGRQVLIHPNGRVLDLATGKQAGRVRITLSNSSPVIAGNDVYCVDTRAARYSMSFDEDGELNIDTIWQARLKGQKVFASPIVTGGRVFTVSSEGIFTVLDAADGSTLISRQLELGEGTFYPSLSQADDLLYVSSENGTTVVLSTTGDCTETARNQVDSFISTPVFAGDSMYLRTHSSLYRIQGKNR